VGPAVTELIAAMSKPGFYPHRPDRVDVVETHISWVFLAGEIAYKLKKPVVFPFLDYGSPERRHELCEEEVRLNRRLAPDMYRGVRGLARRDGRWEVAGSGDPDAEEWAIEMRRFDEGRTLASLLAAGEVGEEQLAEIGRLIARFHENSRVVVDGGSRVEAARRATGDNFDELAGCPEAVPARAIAAGRRFVKRFLASRGEELEARRRAGHVRDCHGDLRTEHVVLGERIEVFDCVEFAPRLREIDVGADLAFLVMDLSHSGRDALASALLASYRDAGGDPGDDLLLSFFAAYRAWVRAKVACLRAGELPARGDRRLAALEEAGRFAATARRFEWRGRGPLLLVVCGGSGTGKTYLAERLATLSGFRHLSSDVVRKELLGLKPTDRAPAEAYTAEADERTYAELGRRACGEVGGGGNAIVDATFRFRRNRATFADELRGVTPVFVECQAPATILAERAARREADPGRVSDADRTQVDLQQRQFEPLEGVPAEPHAVVRTDAPAEELVDVVEVFLDTGNPQRNC
jgi:uncharacterized protein